ncbi:MAG: VOC family protein [Candidatus Lokiarchaeota archaeon]|nr:VOC family protein [Candidatus Lokiarchaeota archaeon]
MRIKYTTIIVKDMGESVRFYTEVMGFAVESRHDLGPAGTITLLRGKGETLVELIENPVDGPGLYSVGMEVEDMDATVEQLRSKGARITMEPRPITVGTLAFIEDPNGARIALIQHH